MMGERTLDIWPDLSGEDREKKPVADKSYIEDNARQNEDDDSQAENLSVKNSQVENTEAEDSQISKFKPNAEEILKRMHDAPGASPEEIARRQQEYSKKVYLSDPVQTEAEKVAEQEAIAKIIANIKKIAESDEPIGEKKSSPDNTRWGDNEREDPWSQINPPSMWPNIPVKKRK